MMITLQNKHDGYSGPTTDASAFDLDDNDNVPVHSKAALRVRPCGSNFSMSG